MTLKTALTINGGTFSQFLELKRNHPETFTRGYAVMFPKQGYTLVSFCKY